MPMPMVSVRKMRMRMRHGAVPVQMAVRSSRLDRHVVLMLMMRVMNMHMLVFQRFMHVGMRVPFRQMQPDAQRHQ